MLLTALLSFVAGLLTVLAPCVLPLLPIILGGSFDQNDKDRKRPYIITASLVASLILFTILLKASTVLIGVDPKVWTIASGLLVIVLGIFMLFPDLWAKIMVKTGMEHRSQSLLGGAFKSKNRTISAILTGAALGPIFSSCSPTYTWVIATVLPLSTITGLFYLIIYCLGVAVSLLAIALLGKKILQKITWASNPKGWLQRIIAILFILVGFLVITGYDKKIQTYFVEKDFLNLIELEQKLVPEEDKPKNESIENSSDKKSYNVDPLYSAPELVGIADWINSEPLTLAELKGKVVLIDFWTYSCINCIRTQPYLNAWYEKYSNEDFVIIGVHAPEFAFEKVTKNVEEASEKAKISYPVALDNDFSTWNAYRNRFWPAKYLIDKDGIVRYTHFGEGEYTETEKIIQELLEESGQKVTDKLELEQISNSAENGQTPETYLGYNRAERLANADQFSPDSPVDYELISTLGEHEWSLGGNWQINEKSSQSLDNNSTLNINFSGKEVYLVMSGKHESKVGVSVEGQNSAGGADVDLDGYIAIDSARLYKVVKLEKFQKNKKLTLTFPSGVTINAFTFGS
ncbi:cytochrome c biogenesis protein DipZ [Candidatus Saccharibacteria bacterium]|nr:cytochrome c biogenesis protein DipZ [Candidatus Saccharibacteria bacterium]